MNEGESVKSRSHTKNFLTMIEKVNRLQNLAKYLTDEWAEIDTHINNVCLANGLSELEVYGNDYGVPTIEDKVDSLVKLLKKDKVRMDWLADPENNIGNVQIPTECVLNHLDSMRDAIDEAMKLECRVDNDKEN